MSSIGRYRVGLPRRHHPFSEFLTLSMVLSRLSLVALFRATTVSRILAFRGFPTQLAPSPFDDASSLAVKCDRISQGHPVSHRLSSPHLSSDNHRNGALKRLILGEPTLTSDFRVLIQLSIRTVSLGVTPRSSRSSPDLFPLQGAQPNCWTFALPSCSFHYRHTAAPR